MNIKYNIIILGVLLLMGCSTSGVYVDEKQVSEFKKGSTTLEQVINELGKPTQRNIDSEGNVELIYSYMEYQTRAETFIPYIGAFVGGGDMRTNTSVFNFNSSGVLENYKISQMEMGTGQNLSSGLQGFDRVETKPRAGND